MITSSTKALGRGRGSTLRSLVVLVLAFGGFVFLGATTAAPASAATNCSGSVVYRTGDSAAELVVYYATASGGTNCARTNHLGSNYGIVRQTSVTLYRCKQTSPGPTCVVEGMDSDAGNFAYYAGPAAVISTKGRCVEAVGSMVVGSTKHAYATVPHAVSCG